MTERFKQAVKDCVADAKLTDAEKELLKKIAKEEGINEIDAEVYIIAQLKIVSMNERRTDLEANRPIKSSDGSTLKTIVEGVLAVAGLVITVLTAKGKLGPSDKNG